MPAEIVDWRDVKKFATDLKQRKNAIINMIALKNPIIALGLMWRFLDLHEGDFKRCDESSAVIGNVLEFDCSEATEIAEHANIHPEVTAR